MQTNLIPLYQDTPQGEKAESILRSCVHCGFCNATCPTYQALGDELDGPRGRIYLIKQMLEGKEVSETTRKHLDRCLTCRACETTCPSGVKYHELLDIGRELALEHAPRSVVERIARKALLSLLGSPKLFGLLLKMGRVCRAVLPNALKANIPQRAQMELGLSKSNAKSIESTQTLLLLEGCVQNAMTPEVNAATRQVLSNLGFRVIHISEQQCCGALQQHMDAQTKAKATVRANIDRWLALVDRENARNIVVNASGCGVFVNDYPELFMDDAEYEQKAQKLAALVIDPVELLEQDLVSGVLEQALNNASQSMTVAYHPPCTLQHGQKLSGAVEMLLSKLGIDVLVPNDSHLCCGSAGTYSIFQPEISRALGDNKWHELKALKPELVVTANIGCQTQLAVRSDVPVVHWLQLLAKLLTNHTKL